MSDVQADGGAPAPGDAGDQTAWILSQIPGDDSPGGYELRPDMVHDARATQIASALQLVRDGPWTGRAQLDAAAEIERRLWLALHERAP